MSGPYETSVIHAVVVGQPLPPFDVTNVVAPCTQTEARSLRVTSVDPNTGVGPDVIALGAAETPTDHSALVVAAASFLFDGAAWVPKLSASSDAVAAQSGQGVQLTALPGQWTIVDAPAVDTIASATKAAGGAGVRHVLQTLDFSSTGSATLPTYVVIRDGATGVGPILYQRLIPGTVLPQLAGLNIVGSENTPMTVEFTVAPTAGNYQCISAAGYSTSA